MIKIIKRDAPRKLVEKGILKTTSELVDYAVNKSKYDSAALKFEALGSMYNLYVARHTLEKIQINKCCYCETKSTRNNNDVKHFTSKVAY